LLNKKKTNHAKKSWNNPLNKIYGFYAKKWTPRRGEPIMLRKFVCVGFHSSQGEDARAVMDGYHENSHQDTMTPSLKKIKFLCVFVPLWQ
jgi:hypothetical protein